MSRTDKPRLPGTHRYGSRVERAYRDGIWYDFEADKRKPVILAATHIHEHAVTSETVQPDLCNWCREILPPVEPLADWERELLAIGGTGTRDDIDPNGREFVDWFCDHTCLEMWTMLHEDLGGSFESVDDQLSMAEQFHALDVRRYDEIDDECWDDVPCAWMPIVSIEECRDIFGGGDFTIDHGNVVRYGHARKPAGTW